MSFRISGVTIIGRTLGSASGSPVSTLTATTVVSTVSAVQNVATSAVTPVTATGGTLPYTYAISPSLPVGLSFNASTGEITGTPTISVLESVYTVTVTDAVSATASGSFMLEVSSNYNEYTSLLLDGVGANNAQNNTFVDSGPNNFTVTRTGNATQGSFGPYSTTNWANYFDGSGDVLSTPSNVALAAGTGDFTMEAWVYPLALNSYNTIMGTRSGATNNTAELSIGFRSTGSVFAYNSGLYETGTGKIQTNRWAHIACTRQSGTLKIFVNGTLEYTTSNTNNLSAQVFYIGGLGTAAAEAANAYISNARFVKGTAVYTSNFTPSAAPLTAVSGTGLLTCQSNRLVDNSTNNFAITKNGDVSVTAFGPFSYNTSYLASTDGGSLYLDGNGDYLTVDYSTGPIVNGDFTWECWAYDLGTKSNGALLGWRNRVSGWTGLVVYKTNSNNLDFSINGTSIFQSTGTYLMKQWNHVAMTRSGSTVRCFVNGVIVGTANVSGSFGTSSYWVGSDPFNNISALQFNGYISNQRFVNGTAVYTSNFTPPTAPVTAITNTSLLLNFANAGIFDSATQNDTETVGNAKISTAQSKWGGSSMYFDGTGGYLSFPSSMAFDQNVPFTIETWIYPTTGGYFYTQLRSGFFCISFDSNGKVFVDRSGVGVAITSSGTFALNQWHHVALTYDGTTTRLFVNGIQQGTYNGGGASSGTTLAVGRYLTGTNYFGGYLQGLRVTRGVARYTSTFTPPVDY